MSAPKSGESYKKKRITAKYIAQEYRHENDDHPVESSPVTIDLTEQVLAMDLQEIVDLIEYNLDPITMDNLIPTSMIHSAFRIDGLEESTAEFFGLAEIHDAETSLTEQALASARLAHGIGKLKPYKVLLQETLTHSAWVTVDAVTAEDAKSIAPERMPTYTPGTAISKIEALQAHSEEEKSPVHQRPRGG